MKVSSFSIIILLTISSIVFIPPIQSTLPKIDFIKHICRTTPHYYLCVITLKSNLYVAKQIASNVNMSEVVRVTLKVVAARAPVVLEQLRKINAQPGQTELKSALDSCITSYTKISKELVPKALNSVDKGDYNDVKQSAYTVGNLADSCAKKWNGTTSSAVKLLGDSNQYVKNMTSITTSIVSELPKLNLQTLT